MTPAERRIAELIDKWLASIDLHLQYTELSDAAYALVQPWPKHDRPTRWVLEVARQKTLQLKSHCESRQTMGDSKFADTLELMYFLSNLVGIQHLQRSIPLADPACTDASYEAAPSAALADNHARGIAQPASAKAAAAAPPARPSAATMRPAAPAAIRQTASQQPARPRRPEAHATAPPERPVPAQATCAIPPEELRRRIVADAVRLLKWGKSWHELPQLIERIAERPAAAEIRKVLRAAKQEIESKAAEGR